MILKNQNNDTCLSDIPLDGWIEISIEELDAIRESRTVAPPMPTYQELRAAAYPPITDYLDGIVKGDAAQVQAYVDACLAVKTKYPKI